MPLLTSLINAPPHPTPHISASKSLNLGPKHLKPKSFEALFQSHHQHFVHMLWEICSKCILEVIFIHKKCCPPLWSALIQAQNTSNTTSFIVRVTISILCIFYGKSIPMYCFLLSKNTPLPFGQPYFKLEIPQTQRLLWLNFRVTISIFTYFIKNLFKIYP